MLETIEGEVHVEVRKLYPEVELPSFATERVGDRQFKMIYESDRPLTYFCKGLIEACIEHFEDPAEVTMVDVPGGPKYKAEFLVQKAA